MDGVLCIFEWRHRLDVVWVAENGVGVDELFTK
jgi:hypothetical protein